MKTIIETSGLGNYLPNILIKLSKYDLSKLIIEGKVEVVDEYKGMDSKNDYFQRTMVELEK